MLALLPGLHKPGSKASMHSPRSATGMLTLLGECMLALLPGLHKPGSKAKCMHDRHCKSINHNVILVACDRGLEIGQTFVPPTGK